MANIVTAPEPGIYVGIPFAEYLTWDAISNSRINLARRSLLHFREAAPVEQTDALKLGSFVHCGVLEPEAVALRYIVMPAFENYPDNKTRDGKQSRSVSTEWYKAKVDEFRRVNADKEPIEPATYKTLLGINRAIARNARASKWLSEPGDTEVAIVWTDEETGLRCKARLDFKRRDEPDVTDLKTSRDAQGFSKAIATYGYHRQGAHYLAGVESCYGTARDFNIIAVEPTPPYGVRSAPLSEDAIETGRSEVRQALRAIADAYSSDEWPGYEDPSSWCLPAYYGAGEAIEIVVDGQTVTI